MDFYKDKLVILITGASGFIGSRLLNELIENKEQKNVNYYTRGLSRHKIQSDNEKLGNS
ncbi:MAG: NAD-dependent epimerase/dehydratase family protein [Candidatus Nitrosocosmicus sp.]|nr:NAD-dependent epimerase/dehydratase family protein [Candidatus Nitrosocosmicus sp.]